MLAPFSPLVRERDYRRRDVTRLLSGTAPLFPGPNDPDPATASATTSATASAAGVPGAAATAAAAVLRPSPAERLAGLDALPEGAPRRDGSVAVAAAVGLWRSARQSVALVAAARAHFLAGMEEARRERKAKLPVMHFFRLLNKWGVDVLVLSKDRARGTALFARKKRSRCKGSKTDTENDNDTEGKEEGGSGKEGRSNVEKLAVGEDQDASIRTLLALEYDEDASLWCALPVALYSPRSKSADAEAPLSVSATRTYAEMSYTNFDKTMFEQTVYNPQHVVRQGDAESPQAADVALDSSPFSGMKYPTIASMDFRLFDLFRRGLHPALRLNRLRFLLSVPAALLAAVMGIAFVAFAAERMELCCFDESRGACAEAGACAAFCAVDGAQSSALRGAPRAFLFDLFGPGRMAVAAVCCLLAAAGAAAAVNFATARTVARPGARPRFAFVAMGAQALLCAAAVALAAFALSVVAAPQRRVPCGAFRNARDAMACEELTRACVDFALRVAEPDGELRVALALAIAHLVFCVAALATSLIPPMPREEEVARMQKAVPVTETFLPSLYAPDGITATEKDALRWRIKRQLRAHLRHELHQSDVLLTRSATIGEMMQKNYEWSFKGSLAREGQSNSQLCLSYSEVTSFPLHYMREELLQSEMYATNSKRSRPLSPQLDAEVTNISARVCKSKRSSLGRDVSPEHSHEEVVSCESPLPSAVEDCVAEEIEKQQLDV